MHSAVANLLGSVSVAVSAHAHCPVVVVRPRPPGVTAASADAAATAGATAHVVATAGATAAATAGATARVVATASATAGTTATAAAPAATDASAAAGPPAHWAGGAGPVVVGVDGSAQSEEALAFAAEQAAARDTGLRVIRAWKPGRGAEGRADAAAIPADERRSFDDLVDAWREKYPLLMISAEAVAEHPAAALTEASAGAGLLVVGSRGRGAFRGMLLGSVSRHLLRHAAGDVAIVHRSRAHRLTVSVM
ncbi:universal stress protein [Actinoplanes sp. CA-030573]|uniref:universal stress protein n=1 Tax=Actinoplanes sp. CA-030573 TaxID=3239898 RepID=UPI003D8F639F